MKRKILVVGAGKSTSYMLDYFLEKSESENLQITIADLNTKDIPGHIKEHPACTLLTLDISATAKRQSAVSAADIVVSMLPARFHAIIAKDCLLLKKNLVTASYVSDEMRCHE